LPRYDANKVCSRPFCKLKKKQLHFHCSVCDQGFSDRSKFRLHAVKHKNSLNTIGNVMPNLGQIQGTKPWNAVKNGGEIPLVSCT
ncbi:zinc finger, C2H2 type, partial [Ancylostoma caninum]